MTIFKKGILVLAFVCLEIDGFCLRVGENPTIDFGTIHYLYGTAGFSEVTVSADGGAPGTGGSGNLVSQSGGSSGTVTFNLEFIDRISVLFGGEIDLTIGTGSYSDNTCGDITISNVHTTGNASSASKSVNATTSSVSFPIGARLTVNNFTGSDSCTLNKKAVSSSAMTGRVSGSANASLNISVIIVPDIAVSHDSASLNFGKICSIATGTQTITVGTDGSVTSPTNLFCPAQGTSADSFTVTGNSDDTFSVSLPASITLSNGVDNLTVSNLTSSCTNNCVLTDNHHTFTVGGTLTIPAGVSVGHYQNNYTVTINY